MSNHAPLTSTQNPLSRDPETILKSYNALSKKFLTLFIIVGTVVTITLYILGLSRNGNDTFNLLGIVTIKYNENPFVGLLILLVMEIVWVIIGGAFSVAINLVGDIIAHMAYFSNKNLSSVTEEAQEPLNNNVPIITHERYWDCSNCGRCNDNIVTTCKCGEKRPY